MCLLVLLCITLRAQRTLVQASEIASASAPAGIGAEPLCVARLVVPVVTISVNPRMRLGKGPCPMMIKGPLSSEILSASGCRAWVMRVRVLMSTRSCAGVACAAMPEARASAEVMTLNETMIAFAV